MQNLDILLTLIFIRDVILYCFFLSLLTLVPILISIAFFTLAERKIIASIQRRRGPNVVGI
jgi:NADH-quinone oxidoreductase subunit H